MVADVLNRHQDLLDKLCSNSWQSRTLHALRKCRTVALGGHIDKCDHCQKTLHALRKCRTVALGGHIDKCDHCQKIHLSYNSCRNRHCPTCQGHKRQQWIQAREKDLLDVPYFHVVLPFHMNSINLVWSSLY